MYIYIYICIPYWLFPTGYSCPLEHLKDLEHGPPPEGGNVILDEFFK